MKRSNSSSYATAVVGVLAEQFPELAEPTTAAIVREAIVRHTNKPSPTFEVVLGSTTANWRLRAHNHHRSMIRLACYRPTLTSSDQDREQHINQLLERIPKPAAR